MEELGSRTEMDENTGCAGPGSDTKKNEDEMGSTKPSVCTCGLQFGVFPLTSQDSKSLNLPKELGNMSINFQGPAGEYQRMLAKEKIKEIKEKVADYYYDSECKVIAIPNHYVTPKKPTVLGKVGKEKQDSQILDKYLEECLHHELVNTARDLKWEAFIMNSFQSGDCIQQLVKKGKDTRGKDLTADFNEHEMRIKKLLNIEDIPKEKLDLCIEEHLKWKENKLEFKDAKSWLFRKECFIDNARVHKEHGGNKKNKIENTFLFKLPSSDLEKFYTYQYYNHSLQESKTEWDSLIIIPELSAIINIEVKLGPKDKGDKTKLLKNALDQTKQHFSFTQKLFGGMLPKDWKFVGAACVPYLEIVEGAEIPCVNCQQFILQDVNNVTPWLKHIIDHKLVTSDNHNQTVYDQTVYEDLVAELIYHISIKESSRFNQLISDPLTISKEVEKALTGKSDGISIDNNVPVYMLNNEQLQAVNSPAKFLIIDGNYGTGKTYVLKERVKKCATDNHEDQIFYIDLTTITIFSYNGKSRTSPTSVMDEMAKVEFESYPNVRVITIRDLIDISTHSMKNTEEIMYSINNFLRENLCDHLFIDEMIIGSCEFPGSVKTICMTMKVVDHLKKGRLETMIKNHIALCLNLTKNLRNSQLIHMFSEAFKLSKTPPKLPDNSVIGSHIYYYQNIHFLSPGLLAIAAVEKYFSLQPQEGVVVLTTLNYNKTFDLLNEHFSSTRQVVSDFKAYINKPEGILVTNFWEFQGAQARNIIIIDDETEEGYVNIWIRNMILRAMSFAIIISRQKVPEGNKFGAIKDKNLHEYIFAEREAIDCHHYHNKDKHDISAITMSILDKYQLLDQDEGIMIVTYRRISKNIMKDTNTKKFSLTEEKRKKQLREKIKLENKELYEELKRNISRKYDEISWSYHDYDYIEDLVNKPRHINHININEFSEFHFNEAMNIIVFADENVDHKCEFAGWGYETLDFSDNETSIDVNWSKINRNKCEAHSRDAIWEAQSKFAIIVHDGKIETFSQPKEALNLIQDDNLHEYITKQNTNLLTEEEHTTKEVEQVNNLPNQ